MGSILFILLIVFVFIAVPLWLPRFVIWLTESRATSETLMPPATSHLQIIGETAGIEKRTREPDSTDSENADFGMLIPTLRFVWTLIFLVGWPILTFILPFTFDDPTPRGTLGRILYIGLYVFYPVAFYFSDAPYKSCFQKGQKVKAVAIASTPFFVLLLFFLLSICLNALF